MMKAKSNNAAGRRIFSGILLSAVILIAFICFFSAKWYVNVFGRIGFDSVLYTLFSDMGGVQEGLVREYLSRAMVPALFCTVLVCFMLMFYSRRKLVLTLFCKYSIQLFPLKCWVRVLLGLGLSAGLILHAAFNSELISYICSTSQLSSIFQEEYRDPKQTQIHFPKQKRNLIYIYLESMETTYLSTQQGGAASHNLIPELYQLAQENINFSHNEDVGGFSSIPGGTWTIGAMVSQTSGVPMKTPPGIDGNGYGLDGVFLPGLTTLQDILHDNGYYQALMVGSDASFGGRQQYFSSHCTDRVYDHYTAIEDGIIPQGYHVWWGMEDKYLFEYAKQELTAMAAQDQPFAFTMLTVDTHHISGYLCEECESIYPEQYENVISCSSRQVGEFVQWLCQQDFYENTTIIIAGDHCSMDAGYFERNIPAYYDRRVYNCFINASVDTDNTKNRQFTSLDMFPTTLAAMGCQIDGERLGLGVNLFSDQPTLSEQIGYSKFADSLSRTSTYYIEHFLAVPESPRG